MGNYNFRMDLAIAKESEREVCSVLETKHKWEIIGRNDTYAYDILAKKDDKEVSFEVKEDFMCYKTNNIAVEYESRGKPSGISITESQYYVYVIHRPAGKEFLSLSTDKVKKLIADNKYFRVVNGGDKGSNTMMYLFKYDVYSKEAKQL